jgi:ribosome-associated toxin RatA of RatAB toxin-antitoxin module
VPTVHQSVIVPHSQQAMYELVDDILKYPEFVHWCVSSQEMARGTDSVKAALTFEFHGIEHTFSTHNTLKPYERMNIALIDGPFDYLTGYWLFKILDSQMCEVVLNLEYAFNIPGLSVVFEPVFAHMAHSWVEAFCHRADALYEDDSD